jgi:outer membrane protein
LLGHLDPEKESSMRFGSPLIHAVVLAAASLPAAAPGLVAQVPSLYSPAPPPAPGSADGLTLNEVVRRALAVSPVVAVGQADARVASATVRSAWGAMLPSLSAGSDLLRSDQSATGPASGANAQTNYSAGLAASMDVFTGGRQRADLRRARAAESQAIAGLLNDRALTTLAAKRAYFELLAAYDAVEVSRARVRTATEGLNSARGRVEAGAATRSDLLRAQLELDAANQDRLDADQDVLTTSFALGRLIGADGPVRVRPPEDQSVHPLAQSDSEIVALALREAPTVQAITAAEATSRAAVRAAQASYLPTVRAGGGYNWADQDPLPGSVRPGWFLRVSLIYPLFDGFHREEAVTRASADQEVASSQLADATRATRAEANRLLGALGIAAERIPLAESSVRSASEDLRVQQARYAAGASSILDLLTSETGVTQAQQRLIAARYNYAVARAELEALLGRDL